MGLFGVLNEIANSEEEGKYFSLQSFPVLRLASHLYVLPNLLAHPNYLLAQPLSRSSIFPGSVVYIGVIFTSPFYLCEWVSRQIVGWKDQGSTHSCLSLT